MKAQWTWSGLYVNTAAPLAHYTLNDRDTLHYPAGGSSLLYCTAGALLHTKYYSTHSPTHLQLYTTAAGYMAGNGMKCDKFLDVTCKRVCVCVCVCVCAYVCVFATRPTTHLPRWTHNVEAGGDLRQLTVQFVSEVVAASTTV